MSTFAVHVVRVAIEPHDNADALEIARVGDYRSVVRKGQFQSGELVAYIPEQALVGDAGPYFPYLELVRALEGELRAAGDEVIDPRRLAHGFGRSAAGPRAVGVGPGGTRAVGSFHCAHRRHGKRFRLVHWRHRQMTPS